MTYQCRENSLEPNVHEKQLDKDTIFQTSGFVDIHSHILPGLDDGPVNLDQSLEAIKRYEALGFGCIIATPHWIPATRWASSPEVIIKKVNEINSILQQKNISMTILPGMEIAFSDQLYDNITSSICLPLDLKDFFLIEFPLSPSISGVSDHFLTKLTADKRLKFIVAHPERCPVFLNNENLLHKLVRLGMLVQVNINSILGGYGKKIQKTSFNFLRAGLVHFLATDSHARADRTPPNNNQWKKLFDIMGEEGIRNAFDTNPRQMLAGKEVRPLAMNEMNFEQSYRAGAGKDLFNTFRKLFNRVLI